MYKRQIVSFGVNSIAASQEDEQMIKDLQKAAVMRDPTMAAANIASAQSDAMRAAAANPNGAMAGFMGMGMAGGMGGMNASQLFAAGQAQQQAAPQPAPAPAPAPAAGTWTCSCGATNTGKFCSCLLYTSPVLRQLRRGARPALWRLLARPGDSV